MLPEAGTPERFALEAEALDVGMTMLSEERGLIGEALYRTYMHFRTKFVTERGLASDDGRWPDALTDARQLEAYVNDTWSKALRERFSAPAGQ